MHLRKIAIPLTILFVAFGGCKRSRTTYPASTTRDAKDAMTEKTESQNPSLTLNIYRIEQRAATAPDAIEIKVQNTSDHNIELLESPDGTADFVFDLRRDGIPVPYLGDDGHGAGNVHLLGSRVIYRLHPGERRAYRFRLTKNFGWLKPGNYHLVVDLPVIPLTTTARCELDFSLVQ